MTTNGSQLGRLPEIGDKGSGRLSTAGVRQDDPGQRQEQPAVEGLRVSDALADLVEIFALMAGDGGKAAAKAWHDSTGWCVELDDRNLSAIGGRPDIVRRRIVGKGHLDTGESIACGGCEAVEEGQFPVHEMQVRTEPDHAGAEPRHASRACWRRSRHRSGTAPRRYCRTGPRNRRGGTASFEELPDACPLATAMGDDAGDQAVEVRIGHANVEDAGFVVAEIIRRVDDRRIEELKQLETDAVGAKHVGLMGPAKSRSENLPDLGHGRPILQGRR